MLAGYERFPNQVVDANDDLIEESTMMAEAKPNNSDQSMNDSNWLVSNH